MVRYIIQKDCSGEAGLIGAINIQTGEKDLQIPGAC